MSMGTGLEPFWDMEAIRGGRREEREERWDVDRESGGGRAKDKSGIVGQNVWKDEFDECERDGGRPKEMK